MRIATVALGVLCASACTDPAPRAASSERGGTRPEARSATRPACELDAPSVRHGVEPALAPGALVLREEGHLRLIPFESDDPPRPLDVERVPPRGLVRTEKGWIALTGTEDGAALMLFAGDAPHPIALGPSSLVDGALAVRGERAVAAWLDDARALRLAHVDLERLEASEPMVLEARVPHGTPLIEATPEGTVVSVRAVGAPLIDIRGERVTHRRAPGLPIALATAPGGELAVLHRARDRTGLWLALGDRPVVRVTHPDARPSRPSLAALPDGLLLAYRAGPDVFVQRLDPDGAPVGDPKVVGQAAGSATPPLLATRGRRFWVAWETRSDPTAVHVRAGRCP